jgi:alpha-galactosidase
MTDHHLRREGQVLQVGTRRFWDFRDPWTHDYLAIKVIALLKDNGFGYLKVDYNDTIGIGVDDLAPAKTDHPPSLASPGEGLRQHLVGVQRFFRTLRKEIPDLVIENCSSGGHRLEPAMMALTSMGSFSDAHETPEIPIIAASLQRLILPRQSQVWAVLRREDSLERLAYSLAATFLGRMCLSGDLHDLDDNQWALATSAMELYQRAAPMIRDGHSMFHGEVGKSWRHAEGWQAVVRSTPSHALVVAHTFGGPLPAAVRIPLPGAGKWGVREVWPGADGLGISIQGSTLQINLTGSHRAAVAILKW